jgi:hypothetical protein
MSSARASLVRPELDVGQGGMGLIGEAGLVMSRAALEAGQERRAGAAWVMSRGGAGDEHTRKERRQSDRMKRERMGLTIFLELAASGYGENIIFRGTALLHSISIKRVKSGIDPLHSIILPNQTSINCKGRPTS